jgi:hypothetical protein
LVGRIEDIDAPLSTKLSAGINDGYLKVVSYTIQTKGNMEASLTGNIIYVRFNVDDTKYHRSSVGEDTGEVFEFKTSADAYGPPLARSPSSLKTVEADIALL